MEAFPRLELAMCTNCQKGNKLACTSCGGVSPTHWISSGNVAYLTLLAISHAMACLIGNGCSNSPAHMPSHSGNVVLVHCIVYWGSSGVATVGHFQYRLAHGQLSAAHVPAAISCVGRSFFALFSMVLQYNYYKNQDQIGKMLCEYICPSILLESHPTLYTYTTTFSWTHRH